MFMPGMLDLTEELDIPEAISFQMAQEQDQPSLVPETIKQKSLKWKISLI